MTPYISPELLEYLREHFPNRCPSETASDRKVWMDAGAARLVEHLETLFEDQLAETLRA